MEKLFEINQLYKGSLVIGDEEYLDTGSGLKYTFSKQRINKDMKFEGYHDKENDLYVAVLNFIGKNHPEFNYDAVTNNITHLTSKKLKTTDLGCDTASFIIEGVDYDKIDTGADGSYGAVYESGDSFAVELFVSSDVSTARNFFTSVAFTLGVSREHLPF